MKKYMDSEDGSAAVVATYVLGLIVFIVVWIVFNPVMDFMSQFGATGTIRISADTIASAAATDTGYRDILIIFLLFWTLAAYIAALRQRTQP